MNIRTFSKNQNAEAYINIIVLFIDLPLIFSMVDVELQPHGIVHTFKKNILKLFECIKLEVFLQFSFLYQIFSLVYIIGIKLAPDDHKSNFKKVGAIPSEPFIT